MIKSIKIRVHPTFFDALEQMRRDLERLEKQVWHNPELTRRIAIRMVDRRRKFAKKNKRVFD